VLHEKIIHEKIAYAGYAGLDGLVIYLILACQCVSIIYTHRGCQCCVGVRAGNEAPYSGALIRL